MPPRRMHVDEVGTDVSLVGRLLAAQFPQWADLPIEPVSSAGTDNALYRLGDDMVVRLPRIHWATGQVDKEHRWLPRLARHLPLAIPVPLAKGTPGEGYPWQWSVYRWLEGETATLERIADPRQLAIDLAQFITALRDIDTAGQLPAGSLRSYRGEPLACRDEETRVAIAACDGLLDVELVTEVWEAHLQIPAWSGPPVWIHGDIQPGNLLAIQGRLSAVIDFGTLAIGDPAVDQIVAWNLLPADSRDTFRESLAVDNATWARGRGWALSIGLVALPYYQSTNPVLAGVSRRAIDEVLADYQHGA
ncbi:MAG: aminoglycoside phosphotransferase family protein [Actinomycetota bacterium]|nr:aminoglycoside phosphotransferase family protein [Actinomycetota bacterium]